MRAWSPPNAVSALAGVEGWSLFARVLIVVELRALVRAACARANVYWPTTVDVRKARLLYKQKQPDLATRPFLSCSDKVLQR